MICNLVSSLQNKKQVGPPFGLSALGPLLADGLFLAPELLEHAHGGAEVCLDIVSRELRLGCGLLRFVSLFPWFGLVVLEVAHLPSTRLTLALGPLLHLKGQREIV